jgi:hypothetical protein
MKIVAHTLLAAAMLAALVSPVRADRCSDLRLFPKTPLTFVPFDRTNPQTGAPYGPGDSITISGATMPAQEAFDGLDALERQLTAFGYTLRDTTEQVLAELGKCDQLLASQVTLAEKVLSDPAGPLSPDTTTEKIRRKLELAMTMIPNWDALYDRIKDPNRDIYLPPVPTYTAPIPAPKRTELKPLAKERSWAWDMGDKNSLWVQVLASFRIDGSKTEVKSVAKGAINAALVGVWEGEVLGADATASAGGVEGTVASLGVKVRAIGKTVFSKTWTQRTIKEGDEKRFDVHPEWSWRFAIGPVPCKGTIGFVGAVGVKYGYEIVPIAISVYTVPFAASKVFAQVGADLVFASAGVGGEVTLINDYVTLQGSFAVSFEDQPSLVLELTGKNSVDCLSGRLYAYARILGFSGTFTIWEWTGYRKDADLFKFRTTWGPNGVTAEGDLTAEDVMEVTADQEERRLVDLENASHQRVFEVFDATGRDLNGAAAALVSFERDRQAAISHAIDDTIAQYQAELNRTTGGG